MFNFYIFADSILAHSPCQYVFTETVFYSGLGPYTTIHEQTTVRLKLVDKPPWCHF